MPWERDFRVSTITLDIDNAALTPIRGIVSASAQTNAEVESEQAAGSIFADTVTLRRIRPTIQFSTHDIPSAIAQFGLLGKCILSDGDDEGLAFFGQRQGCAGIASGSVHDKYLIKSAIVVPNTLQVDHLGNAVLSYDVYARYDGTNAPIVYSQNNALPTVGLGPIGRWTMNSLSVGGQAVTGKRSVAIDFGASVQQEGADSDIYDSVVSLSSVLPVLTVRGVDTSWLNSIATLLGANATNANTLLYLKRRDRATTDASHIALRFSGLVTMDQLFNFSISSPAEASFRVTCHHDGTNAPITVLTGQTIGA